MYQRNVLIFLYLDYNANDLETLEVEDIDWSP